MSEAGVPWLPHGPEFLFVDQVLSHRPGRSVVGRLDLGGRGRRPSYSGNFPGSYLLESMIQTCGLLFEREAEAAPALAMVVALDRVRWFGFPGERDRVINRCRLVRRSGPFLRCRCVARREGGDLLASAHVTLKVSVRAAPGPE